MLAGTVAVVREADGYPRARPRDRAGIRKPPGGLHPAGGLSSSCHDSSLPDVTTLPRARTMCFLVSRLRQVVTTLLHIRQELGKSAPVHDVGASFRPLAITHRGHTFQVGRDFHAAAVVRTTAGFPPDGLRQVGH